MSFTSFSRLGIRRTNLLSTALEDTLWQLGTWRGFASEEPPTISIDRSGLYRPDSSEPPHVNKEPETALTKQLKALIRVDLLTAGFLYSVMAACADTMPHLHATAFLADSLICLQYTASSSQFKYLLASADEEVQRSNTTLCCA